MIHPSKLWLLPAIAMCALGILFAADDGPKKEAPPKGDAMRGKDVFEQTCEECHDAYTKETYVGPGLKGIKEGKLPDGKKATRESLLNIINLGPAEMPSFEDRLTDQQKEDVVAFVLTL